MWLPSHSRSVRVHGPTLFLITAVCSVTGCTALPKFTDSDDRPSSFVATKDIPAPVFDDPPAVTQRSQRLDPANEDEQPEPSRVASAKDTGGLVDAPGPFAWKAVATSAGERAIQAVTIGRGGYRCVVLGSLAGDDPLAVRLTEELAQHIHKNQIIVGGVEVTVIRNTNPDGEADFRMENGNGVYLNRQFTGDPETVAGIEQLEPEVRFLVGLLNDKRPQRVIHIRTVSTDNGVIAAGSSAATAAREVCDWLNFRFIELPGRSAQGTLERFLSQKKSCEVITFAFPQSADRSALWEKYGDSLLNLLLADDFRTRALVRRQKKSVAADRRTEKHQRDDEQSFSD